MAKVPFSVSARAARLIGRENVGTPQGAVTELVKNAYDADSTVCAVLFLPRWSELPAKITQREHDTLLRLAPNIDKFFVPDGDMWALTSCNFVEDQETLAEAFAQFLELWIVDNGHGMSAETIRDRWMVIGTDTKEINDRSVGGRVVTGAKGIGRFALDRLGQECELFSALPDSSETTHWLVDWTEFEGAGKIISDVEAVLEIEARHLSDAYVEFGLDAVLPKVGPSRDDESKPLDFTKGTAIRIGFLHDVWDARDSLRLKETLEALLPPHDRGDFDIFVYDHRAPAESGFIDNFPPDHFDYRMVARVGETGEITITLDRREIDVPRIRSRVFQLEAMKKAPFRKQDFDAGSVTYTTDLGRLTGAKDEALADYKAIGPFSFTLYFFKLTNPTSDNLLRYPQKSFDVGKRRRWLKSSGGIRLYRDNFRVRPYGEPGSTTYDWLLLGDRVARNPAPASRIGWRVPPTQVAGTLHISKVGNPHLADQSSREGVMNERAFEAFRTIVLALIKEFENDRAYVLGQFSAAFDLDHEEEKEAEQGRRIAEELLGKADASEPADDEEQFPPVEVQSDLFDQQKTPIEEAQRDNELALRQVSQAYSSEVRKNESLRDDIQVMRGMATLGTVLVSFTHELKQVKTNIDSRSQRLSDAIEKVADQDRLAALTPAHNPFRMLERLRRQDEKVSRWVNFALSAVSPAKRRRRVVNLAEYLAGVESYWEEFLQSKSISLGIGPSSIKSLTVLAHEIDLDSIFYNLINNSVEALVKPSAPMERKIKIDINAEDDGWIDIRYNDNGPGIPNEFNIAEDIFQFGTSSKKEAVSGDAAGTGLGMWLLKTVVEEYRGSVSLQSAMGEPGFSISIRLPMYRSPSAEAMNG
ncbi:sensor histidine kinase [Novosphingobium sp. ERW19]|uniref:sensor histidine kinase n=1 Tax=Novosphingobium sp. ERW19 TaxID=2726186 RepID=UPI0014574012|nr:sensor histidine kinase [Novosphingobium sp. ERW19]NLR41675.1 sensor histidine kinase [Novosphingobium sp. ERW19]